jgi:glyoxylase-like metal-dependent hydrolase (beta-lactamase superfamily II)
MNLPRCAAVAIFAFTSHAFAAGSPLATAAKNLDVANVRSLEFEAAGRYYQFGQAAAPELGWPPFTVDGYVATLDFARGAVHARYHRVQVQEPGRARPFSEQTMDQYAVNGVSWNLAPGPVAMPGNLAERNAELRAWAPQAFIKAALASGATVTPAGKGARATFNVGAYRYEGDFDAAGELVRVRSWIDSPVLGDTPIEFLYSDYQDFGGVRFPKTLRRTVAGLPWYELTVSAVRINTAQAFDVPAPVAADPAPSVANIEVTELAPGLLSFGGGSHNSIIVQQHDGIVVIEAPLSEQRSEAVIAKVHALFPGKKITQVINTHTHFDHAGGLRTYVDEGIPVVTLARNANYYAGAWAAPHTLSPDRLAKSKRAAAFRAFSGRMTIADDTHPLELHEIQGSGHNDAFAMIYLPKDGVLVEADAWTPAAAGAAAPAVVNPLWINLYDNIRRLGLEVRTIAPLHGTPRTLQQLRAAIGAQD